MIIQHLFIVLFTVISRVHAGCPRATFEFFNNTIKAPYNFIDSSVGNIGSLETCPYTGRPYVYLPCYPNSTWGDEPYFSSCVKASNQTDGRLSLLPILNRHLRLNIEQIAKLPMNTSTDVSNVLFYLNQDTLTFQSASDIKTAVDMIDRLSPSNLNSEMPRQVYSVADKLLSSMSIAPSTSNGSVVKLLSSLEMFSQTFPSTELDQRYSSANLAVSIVNMPTARPKPIVGFAFDTIDNQTYPMSYNETRNSSISITLDSSALLRQNRLAFSVYDHRSGLFNSDRYQLLSRVVSLTIDKPYLTKHLRSFVKMNFYVKNHRKRGNATIICAYWHIYPNQTARWSTDGCELIDYDHDNVRCQCDHLTHFAILMDINPNETPKSVEQVLSIITLIGLSLSSLGLCLTILTFLLFKKLRHHFSQKSLLLLSINLLLVNILFTLLSFSTWPDGTCVALASLLHYFILSTFSWMFIMALIQYLLFVKVFPRSNSAFTRKAAAFAQLIPLIPVGVVLLLNPGNYVRHSNEICWLMGYPLYLSFLLPIAIFVVINTILFSLVAHSLLCAKRLRSSQLAESQRLSRFTVTLSCFVVLGFTWIFGFFIIGSVRILFQILFCVFATSTGFLIFVLYILNSKAKRTCWNNALKSMGISSIYSPTLSSSSAFTGHKELSTSSTTDQQKSSSRHVLCSTSQPQHFIDAYMPSSPPPPAPPLPFLVEGDDRLNIYEARHVWSPQTNYIYESNSLDDYSLFYASNHDATKL